MFGNRGIHLVKGLTFGEVRQGDGFCRVLRLLLQGCAENAVDLTPALGEDAPPLGGEGVSTTVKSGRDRFIYIGFRRRTQQLPAHQQQGVPFSHSQFGQVGFLQLQRGDNGVVVGHLPIIHQRCNIREEVRASIEGRHLRRQIQDHRGGLRHIAGQIPAVRPGVGQQLLLVQRLCVVQGLLGRVTEHPVCLPLQGGQVVELGRRLFLFLMGDGGADHRSPGTGPPQVLRLLRGSNLLGHRFGPIQRQAHMMVFLLAE